MWGNKRLLEKVELLPGLGQQDLTTIAVCDKTKFFSKVDENIDSLCVARKNATFKSSSSMHIVVWGGAYDKEH